MNTQQTDLKLICGEWHRAWASCNQSGLTDDERNAMVIGELDQVEDRLVETPAGTLAEAAEKARILAIQLRDESETCCLMQLTRSLIADIEWLAAS